VIDFEVELSVTEKGRKAPQYSIETDLDGKVTLADLLVWLKTSLIVVADSVLTEEQAKGFDKKPVLTVDGLARKQVQNVSPFGKIEFTARQYIDSIVLETYAGLIRRSKVLTGQYIASHYVFLNGTQVATDMESLKAWFLTTPEIKDKDTIRIVNIQPYARRLELLGVTAQRSNPRTEDAGRRSKKKKGTQVKIPNGAYQLTVRSVRAKYKNNVKIGFKFLPGSSLGLAATFKSGRRKDSSGRTYLYPSIVFNISPRGLFDGSE